MLCYGKSTSPQGESIEPFNCNAEGPGWNQVMIGGALGVKSPEYERKPFIRYFCYVLLLLIHRMNSLLNAFNFLVGN